MLTDLLKGTLRAAEGEETELLICPPTHIFPPSLWIQAIYATLYALYNTMQVCVALCDLFGSM